MDRGYRSLICSIDGLLFLVVQSMLFNPLEVPPMFSKSRWLVACCSLLFFGVSTLVAQDKKVPEAKQILVGHIQAIGGQAKIDGIQVLHTKSKMSIRGLGVGGKLTILYGPGGKFKQTMDIDGIGTESAGSDGKTVWGNSAISGAKLLEGTQAEQLKLRSVPFPIAQYEKFFDSIECTGVEKFDGVDCYVTKSIKGDQKPVFDYFETSTGLHRGTKETLYTDQGEFEATSTFGDYRDVEGIKFPFLNVTTVGPQAVETQTLEIIPNSKFKPDEFDLPKEVQDLKK